MQRRVKICPYCNQEIHGYPATSRKDNKTTICSRCALAEALHDYSLGEQAKTSKIVH